MISPVVIRGGVVLRAVWLVIGLALFGLGIVMLLESELGLSPWDVLNQGISERTPLSFGTANIAVSLAVLAGAWALGARIGPGTLANAVLIGLFVDLLLRVESVERLAQQPWPVRVALLVGGILVIGLGSGLYIGAGLGAGPRDSLMLVLASRSGTRMGAVRAALEVSATALGFALGGTVGIGTLAFALAIGPAVELSFWLLERTPLVSPAGSGSAGADPDREIPPAAGKSLKRG